jgi:hypothetical protein
VAENTDHVEPALPSSAPAPWREESRGRLRNETPPASEPVEAAPAAKQRRNLLFSSTLRRERERAAQARTADSSTTDPGSGPGAAPPVEPGGVPPTFEDSWLKSERARGADLPRRTGRTPSTFTDASPETGGADSDSPAAPNEDQPPVTVLKSGVVDGMAYSLYSDGSIEAQMPEGMMRFASIDELRTHLDQRP